MPGSRGDMSKSPEFDAVRVNFVPCAVDVAVTIAPGTTAPVESVITPLIAPLPASWALAEELHNNAMAVRRMSNPENTRTLDIPRRRVVCLWILLNVII